MQERHDFEYQRNLDEHLTTEEKVSELWREREIRLYMKQRRMVLFGIWTKCLTAAATAATLVSVFMGNWKK